MRGRDLGRLRLLGVEVDDGDVVTLRPAACASRPRTSATAALRRWRTHPARCRPAAPAAGCCRRRSRPPPTTCPPGSIARRQAVHEHHEVVEVPPGRRLGRRLDGAAPARHLVAEGLEQQAEGAVEVEAVAAAPALDDPLGGLGVVDRRRPAALDLEVLEDHALEVAGLQVGQRLRPTAGRHRQRRCGRGSPRRRRRAQRARPQPVVPNIRSPASPRPGTGGASARRDGCRWRRSRSAPRGGCRGSAGSPPAPPAGRPAAIRGSRFLAAGPPRRRRCWRWPASGPARPPGVRPRRAAGARSSRSARACPRRAACPRWPTRAPAQQPQEAVDHPEPGAQDGHDRDLRLQPARRSPARAACRSCASTVGRSRVDSTARIAEASLSAWRKAPCGVDASRRTARRSSRTGCWTTVRPSGMPARDYICCAAMETRLLIGGEPVAGEGPRSPSRTRHRGDAGRGRRAGRRAARRRGRRRPRAARGWADTPAAERAELLHEVARGCARAPTSWPS